MCGWLRKLGDSGLGYKTYWYMLSNHCLYFFNKKEDIDPIGFFPLENVAVKTYPNRPKHFELYPAQVGSSIKSAIYPKMRSMSSRTLISHQSHKNVLFQADSIEDQAKWIVVLSKNVLTNEFRNSNNNVIMLPQNSAGSMSLSSKSNNSLNQASSSKSVEIDDAVEVESASDEESDTSCVTTMPSVKPPSLIVLPPSPNRESSVRLLSPREFTIIA